MPEDAACKNVRGILYADSTTLCACVWLLSVPKPFRTGALGPWMPESWASTHPSTGACLQVSLQGAIAGSEYKVRGCTLNP